MKLVVKQTMENDQIIFSIIMGGEIQFSEENTSPLEVDNVEVWASGPWYPTPNALIRNLVLTTSSCRSYVWSDFFI